MSAQSGHSPDTSPIRSSGSGGEETTPVYNVLTAQIACKMGEMGNLGCVGGSDNDAMKVGA